MPKKSPKQLFRRLFYSYTAVLLFIVAALVIYFIAATKSSIRETTLGYMTMMNEKSLSYLEECSNNTDTIQNEMYRSESSLEDLLNYLRYDSEEYWRYRLDTYMDSSSLSYNGYNHFIQRMIREYPTISYMELISYDRMELTKIYQGEKSFRYGDIDKRLEEVRENNLAAEGEFSFQKEIRDPHTMQIVGCLIITYKSDEFAAIKNYYSRADMIIYNNSGTVVFDTSEKFVPEDIINAEKKGESEEFLNAYVKRGAVKGYMVCSFLEKKQADPIPFSILLTILGIGAFVIIAGELIVNYHLRRLTERLNYILDGMNEVTTGDLGVRLNADEDGDELDLISVQFNEMCMKLDRYIQKSYLAEIEQKNAELEVLQNQINPHFLYNTLEAIRMKAISNGDREVGKMLYSMAVIFRSQLKEADVITVIQELHYCKKYLELFEYRYTGKFRSIVECPEDLMNYPIIKFILQPVLENYFVHGIRALEGGNEIKIMVEKEENALVIHVIDNGMGMDEEKMLLKNTELSGSGQGNRKTIGLMNVNRRIKSVYGAEYGISLAHSDTLGMHVTVKVGLGEETEDEKGNAG